MWDFPSMPFVLHQRRRRNLFVFRLAWIILTFYHNDIRICNYSDDIVMFRLHTAIFLSFFVNFCRIINFQNIKVGLPLLTRVML